MPGGGTLEPVSATHLLLTEIIMESYFKEQSCPPLVLSALVHAQLKPEKPQPFCPRDPTHRPQALGIPTPRTGPGPQIATTLKFC
jgi:hypothetical protein